MTVKINGNMRVEDETLPFDRVFHDVESFDIVGDYTTIKTYRQNIVLDISIGRLEVTP